MRGNEGSPRRTGEKAGWIGGWIGGFLWVAILAVAFLVQGRIGAGASGLAIVAVAAALVALTAPWRRPRTPYWRLLLAPYALLAASVVWAVLAFGVDALRAEGMSAWSFGLVVPLLLPLLNGGRRRWSDGAR